VDISDTPFFSKNWNPVCGSPQLQALPSTQTALRALLAGAAGNFFGGCCGDAFPMETGTVLKKQDIRTSNHIQPIQVLKLLEFEPDMGACGIQYSTLECVEKW